MVPTVPTIKTTVPTTVLMVPTIKPYIGVPSGAHALGVDLFQRGPGSCTERQGLCLHRQTHVPSHLEKAAGTL